GCAMTNGRGPRPVLPPRVIQRVGVSGASGADEWFAFDVDTQVAHLHARVPPAVGERLQLTLFPQGASGLGHVAPTFTFQGQVSQTGDRADPHAYCILVEAAHLPSILAWLGWAPNDVPAAECAPDLLAELRELATRLEGLQDASPPPSTPMDVDAVLLEFDMAPPSHDDALDLAGHTLHLTEVLLDHEELSILDRPASLKGGAHLGGGLRGASEPQPNMLRLDVAQRAELPSLAVALPPIQMAMPDAPPSPSLDISSFQPFQDDEATVAVPAVAMQALDFEFEQQTEDHDVAVDVTSEAPTPRESAGLADAGVGYSQVGRDRSEKPSVPRPPVGERHAQQRPPSPVATPLEQLLAPLAGWPPGRGPLRR
ncbi:MAG: hypothetical protein ACO3JL_13835, partial [Myxococcota bacterium]